LKLLKFGFLIALIVLPTSSWAQFEPGATIITANVNYGNGKVKSLEDRYDAWGFSGTFEKVLTDNQWSVAFSIAWMAATLSTTVDSNGSTVTSDVSTVPFSVSGRYNVGSDWARAYGGLGLGMSSTWINTNVLSSNGLETYSRKTSPGFALSIPVGVWIRLNEKAYINVNYTPHFMFDNDIQDGPLHTLGFGFSFPG
jgi:hypothetical protein